MKQISTSPLDPYDNKLGQTEISMILHDINPTQSKVSEVSPTP